MNRKTALRTTPHSGLATLDPLADFGRLLRLSKTASHSFALYSTALHVLRSQTLWCIMVVRLRRLSSTCNGNQANTAVSQPQAVEPFSHPPERRVAYGAFTGVFTAPPTAVRVRRLCAS